MPELPEVEAARRAVEEHCSGRLIVRASVAEDPKVIEGVAPFQMQQTLLGKRIVAAHRKGKQLWLELDEKPWPCFQFGMTGAVHIKGVQVTKYVRSAVKDDEEWPSKYSKVFLELDNGLEMSFTDKRRFARVRLLDNPMETPPVSELGPDALLELPMDEDFYKTFTKKKISIKALLLDQSIISGIGNWIADEVLYQARIHPEQPTSSLSSEDCKRLLASIREVLVMAVNTGADALKYPKNWIYHYREKKAGEAFVDGKKIEFITVGGRTSAYVPELQKCSGVAVEVVQTSTRKKVSKKKAEKVHHDDVDDNSPMTGTKKAISEAKIKSKPLSHKRVTKEKAASSHVDMKQSSEEEKMHMENKELEKKESQSDDVHTVAPKRRRKPSKSAVLHPQSEEATKDWSTRDDGAVNDVIGLDVVSILPFESYSSADRKPQEPASTMSSLWPSFSSSASFSCSHFHGRTTSLLVSQGRSRSYPQSALYSGAFEHFKQMQPSGKLHIKPQEQLHFGAKVFSYILRRSACFF